MYRSVTELTRDELDELKEAYAEQEDSIFRGGWEVPDEVVIEHYAGFGFVAEDFFCNLANDGDTF